MPSDVLYTHPNALICQNKNGGGGPITYQFIIYYGVVRGAKLKVFSKGEPVYLSRPIQKLYPVEVGRGCKILHDSKAGENDGAEVSTGVRRTPKRAAAIDSDWKTRAMLDPQPQS